MIEPLTLAALGEFLQMLMNAFDDFIYFAFVIMITFAVARGIQKLFLVRKES